VRAVHGFTVWGCAAAAAAAAAARRAAEPPGRRPAQLHVLCSAARRYSTIALLRSLSARETDSSV